MKATYQYSWLWLLSAILMMPLAYGQDETILVANFTNGNTLALNSRVYLWNPSDADASLIARVYTLQRSGPSTLIGTVDLGLLNLKSARNIKLAEDILQPLIDVGATIGDGSPLTLPYFANGGNLTVEFTIGADKVLGVAQVFTDNFAFGTYPLQEPSGAITSSEIQDGAIVSNKIAAFAVSTSKIAAFSVSNSKIAAFAVSNSKIADGAVSNSKIANGAVSNSKIANGAVGSAQLADQVNFGASNSPGQIDLVNSNNTQVFTARVSGDGGLLNIFNSSGNTTTILGHIDDDGALNILNSAGDLRVFLGVSNNGGRITVADSSNTTTAGINGSTGDVFGTSKSFIVDDPNNSSRKIRYTSLEGPEAAIYVRGTANLVSGRAYIELPEHFSAMAAPSSITVSLTPRSASSLGLAAVNVSSQGIQVAELAGGRNSYPFDYVAHAVRKGYEDYEVYLTKEQASKLTGQTARMVKAMPPVQPKQ